MDKRGLCEKEYVVNYQKEAGQVINPQESSTHMHSRQKEGSRANLGRHLGEAASRRFCRWPSQCGRVAPRRDRYGTSTTTLKNRIAAFSAADTPSTPFELGDNFSKFLYHMALFHLV